MHKLFIILFFVVVTSHAASAQHKRPGRSLTIQDTLRGSITPERAWWDVVSYNITVRPEFRAKRIEGSNTIRIRVLSTGSTMQVDMQQPMKIVNAVHEGKTLELRRLGNVYYLKFGQPLHKGTVTDIRISFEGAPREAVTPPWDGGWIWKTDRRGNPWMSVACQILGGSVWYPCKDHQSDEPDSARLNIIVPDSLVGVGNGRLIGKEENEKDGTVMYSWNVSNPINSYNIVPYIGRYAHWSRSFGGERGQLDLDYWVLEENEEKARAQFGQVPGMLRCFEHWFGPYPFYEDGFKIVESPHLGMEHQSAIAYGNRFENGYLGNDLSGTGWGKKWDFILVHESGHEWFGNSITAKDVADMWIHEGFTNYSEVLYTQCEFGMEAGNEYSIGLRNRVVNDKPVIGPYGVNREGSGDMYFKASGMIHTIRQLIGDDEKFRNILRSMSADFFHQTVTTSQVEKYICRKTGMDLSKVFDQYLRTTMIPVLEYRKEKEKLSFRWTNCVKGFNMPVKVRGDTEQWLRPTEAWKSVPFTGSAPSIDPNFYVRSRKM